MLEVIFGMFVMEVWLDFPLKTLLTVVVTSLFVPKFTLDSVFATLLYEFPYSCFDYDRSSLEELYEYPSFLELATDFLLLISSRLELIRFNSFGSVNNEF